MAQRTTRPIEITERRTAIFWSNVTKPDGEQGCWEWIGPSDQDGYGHLGGKCVRAHRYAWTLLVGPIPPRLVIDHLCRVHSCVNPAHMEPVENGVNVLRGFGPPAQNKLRTHCCRGHDITEPGSYYVRPSRPRERRCKECSNSRDRVGEWARRKRAA